MSDFGAAFSVCFSGCSVSKSSMNVLNSSSFSGGFDGIPISEASISIGIRSSLTISCKSWSTSMPKSEEIVLASFVALSVVEYMGGTSGNSGGMEGLSIVEVMLEGSIETARDCFILGQGANFKSVSVDCRVAAFPVRTVSIKQRIRS